jgi:tetratricopeptide (TPR) repeat protein
MPAFLVVIVLLIVTYSACKKPVTAMTEVYKGRPALMAGNAQTALAHFHTAELDPTYISARFHSPRLPITGRALYQLGRFLEARHALEQAMLRFKNDSIARLYLGLAEQLWRKKKFTLILLSPHYETRKTRSTSSRTSRYRQLVLPISYFSFFEGPA